MLVMGACLFTACDEDRDSNPTVKSPTTFVLNKPAISNAVIDLANSGKINVTCSQPDYGFPANTDYSLEASLNANMEDAFEVVTAQKSAVLGIDAASMAATLTDKIKATGKNEADFPVNVKVYLRAKAVQVTAYGTAIKGTEIMSNIVELSQVLVEYSLPPVKIPEQLYVVGNFNGWKWDTAPAMVPVHSAPNVFWRMVWVDNVGIKFNSEKTWNDNVVEYDKAVVGGELVGDILKGDNGNFKSSTPGWYLVIVTMSVSNGKIIYNVDFNKPEVWLMGPVTPEAGWAEKEEGCSFEVPATKDGEFVSPAFAHASNEDAGLRAYVKVPGFDWWKSEFMVFNKKLVYRGAGDDQERIVVSAGQKLYINFSNDTGDIK